MPLEVGVGWTVTHFQLKLGLAHVLSAEHTAFSGENPHD